MTCGPIIQEVLQGLRPGSATERLQARFLALPCLADPVPLSLFLEAAAIYREGRSRGRTIRSSTDCFDRSHHHRQQLFGVSFVAIERHTKLVLNFALGRRDTATTKIFIEGLCAATSARQKFKITADGFQPYSPAICDTLSDRISGYAKLIKVYGQPVDGEARYSPAEVVDAEVVPVFGNAEPDRTCTSIVERQNLTIRMQMRRLTRPTNASSKKRDNLWRAYCLHFAYYNFCRTHKTLRVAPTMEAGITDHMWYLAELVA